MCAFNCEPLERAWLSCRGFEGFATLTVTFAASQRGKHDLHLEQSLQLREHTCTPAARYATQLFCESRTRNENTEDAMTSLIQLPSPFI